jgi:hypothetical protein
LLPAAKAFISNQFIDGPSDYKIFHSNNSNIVFHFVTTAIEDLHSIRYLFRTCRIGPSLKNITIRVSSHHFDVIETKYPWEEEFIEEDFQALVRRYVLEYLASVKEYHFTFRRHYYVKSKAQKEKWTLNMHKFEEYVRKYVSKVKEDRGEMLRSASTSKMFPISATPLKNRSITKSSTNADMAPAQVPAAGITSAQLPETAEEMIKLRKKDGKRGMGLIARLKAKERGEQNGDSASQLSSR